MSKSSDIFKSCFSPGYLVAYALILAAQFASYPLHEYLHVLFFASSVFCASIIIRDAADIIAKLPAPGIYCWGY